MYSNPIYANEHNEQPDLKLINCSRGLLNFTQVSKLVRSSNEQKLPHVLIVFEIPIVFQRAKINDFYYRVS